jgi:hypothetical protein
MPLLTALADAYTSYSRPRGRGRPPMPTLSKVSSTARLSLRIRAGCRPLWLPAIALPPAGDSRGRTPSADECGWRSRGRSEVERGAPSSTN